MKKLFLNSNIFYNCTLVICAWLQFGFLSVVIAEETPKQVGQCFGFLGQLLKMEGPGNFTQLNTNYIVKNNSALEVISKIGKEQRGCLKPGVDMETCLLSYNDYQKTLFYGYNSGRQGYLDVRVTDPDRKATWQMACSSVN